ncbi:hypothetical protein HYU50_04385 [Candidatus Woesearchaeota archaeon]|nr:hypothetical protein [Candidatus Woesearchaeota archaeon]
MNRLKVVGKDGKTDITATINPGLLKGWEMQVDKLSKDLKKMQEWDAKKTVQPFVTNDLLEDLLKSQTPKWVNYTILAVSILAFLIGLWALLHGYNII